MVDLIGQQAQYPRKKCLSSCIIVGRYLCMFMYELQGYSTVEVQFVVSSVLEKTRTVHKNSDLHEMFTTSIAFWPPSRTFLPSLTLGVGVQHGLSFNDPFKQHNSNSSICVFLQLSRLCRILDLFNTIVNDTCSKERYSIRLPKKTITLLLLIFYW